MNLITIITSESGVRSRNVEHSDAASHIAARGSYSTESALLLAFIAADEEELPATLIDPDGDTWNLLSESHQKEENESHLIYQLDSQS